MKFWRRWLAIALLAMAIAIVGRQLLPVPIYSTESQSEKLQAVWITDLATTVLGATRHLDRVSYRLAELHFNTVYPAVWDRGYTLYPSQVTLNQYGRKQAPLARWLPIADPLQVFVNTARRQGLNIVPWFEYGLSIPATSELVRNHPDWILKTASGAVHLDSAPKPSPWFENLPAPLKRAALERTGTAIVWLNPAHPGVRKFFVSLFVEAVQNYEIDGIALDDHWSYPVELGYDDYTRDRYRQERGIRPPDNPREPNWMRWRAEQLTSLTAEIYRAVKAIAPDCLVSVHPNPSDFAYDFYLQDWVRWVRAGITDEIVVQVYRPTAAEVARALADPGIAAAKRYVPVSAGIYTGSIWEPKAIAEIARQAQTALNRGLDGVSFFSWETAIGWFKADKDSAISPIYREELVTAQP